MPFEPATVPKLPPVPPESFLQRAGPWQLRMMAMLVGIGVFLLVGILHWLTVSPSHFWDAPRMAADAVAAMVVALLAGNLFHYISERRRATVARLHMIAEMNHHIRNALAVIALSMFTSRDEQAVAAIEEGVRRIDWALREILPHD